MWFAAQTRWIALFVLCVLVNVVASACTARATDATGTLTELPEPVVVSSPGTIWYVRAGFDERWAAADVDPARDSNWRVVPAAADFYRQTDGRLPSGWVTLRTRLPDAVIGWLRNAAGRDGAGWPLAIRAGRSGDSALYFLGGKLIGQLGTETDSAYGFRLLTSLPDIPAEQPDLTIALFSPDGRLSWHEGDVRIGPADAIFATSRHREIIELFVIGTYLVVGLYHLLLSLWRWSDRHNFYFGVFCICVCLYWFLRTDTSQEWPGFTGPARTRLEYASLYSIGPLFMLALSQLLFHRVDRVAFAYSALCLGFMLVALLAPFSVALDTMSLWHASVIPVIPYTIWFVLREARCGNLDARYLATGVVVQLLAAVHDILASRSIIMTPQIGRYTLLLFVLGMAAVLANRFMRVHNEVEELNANLEQKVRKRTRELERSLGRVQTLKQKQDGDYFLTSLLLKPLSGNHNHLPAVEVQIYERQFKRFIFRKRLMELGGDFSTSHTIVLRNGPCTVFMNGDAMGKSMQGAGGALVLGTVFKAIIQRTMRSPEESEKYPELWLRDTFEELQSVFESFDGSMLVSLVAGIIEERSGMFYWINAEHPRMVLYRDGRAEFLEPEPRIRKLGVYYFDDQTLRIRSCRLKENDVVISGSDGRDDLLIGFDAHGGRLINENELEFLRRVEDGDGLLDRITDALARHGRLTDDFSMVRISYREDFPVHKDDPGLEPSAHVTDPLTGQSGDRRLREFQLACESRDWATAVKLGHALDQNCGLSEESLYELMLAANHAGDALTARLHAWRYLLRVPEGPRAPEILRFLSDA